MNISFFAAKIIPKGLYASFRVLPEAAHYFFSSLICACRWTDRTASEVAMFSF